MSLNQALSAAVAGLRVTQSGLSLVAANVANAETPGYVRKAQTQVTTAAGQLGISVRTEAINRTFDQFVLRQLRVEMSGAGYADLRAQFYDRLQTVYGEPGSEAALETAFNKFTTALQTLSTSPESSSARSAALSAAEVLTQQLNGMTQDVPGRRTDAVLGVDDAVRQANQAMKQIAAINQKLGSANANDGTAAVLKDQRDYYVNQLSQLMDVKVVEGGYNQVTVFTTSGVQLVGTEAATLAFDAQGTITPESAWSPDDATRTVGTITLINSTGGTFDLIANSSIRSGKIKALLEMRDEVLVEAQAQLDEFAATLSRALSDRTVDGTAVTSGAQSGFDIDLGTLIDGNTASIVYTETATGTQRRVTFVRTDDPSVLPLPATATSDPNDRVVGLDFSGGMASVLAQINTALGATGLQISNPAGTTIRVLDDGLGNQRDVDAASTTYTVTSLTAGTAELPFFTDAGDPYTGAVSALGHQSVGLAGRIVVNSSLLADPSRLVVYQTTPATLSGDTTRPGFLYGQLTSAMYAYRPQSGVGTSTSPFSGTVSAYLRQVVSQQGDAATNASSVQQGQEIVLNSLQQRFDEGATVNVDEEMASLLQLQNAYGANARVLTAVKEMLDLMLKM